ncbi:MAG: metallophosphoesterase [Verrucomicrobiota bacterium]
MKRIGILSLMLLSAILCAASDSFARDLAEEKPAGVQPEVSAFAAGAPSKHPFTLDRGGIQGLDDERSVIVIISDLHLGMDDRYAEIQKNRTALVDFLQKLRRAPNIKELVIAGDLIDEWFIPANTDTYAGKSQKEFVLAVAANNKDVVNAFNDIIRDGTIKVTYVPGNHDLLITSESIQTVFPGLAEARDARGLGTYTPDGQPKIAIEHGHRYNFFCAPDPISNQSIAPGSILPPGYFFTRIATLSVVEGKPEPGKIRPAVTPNTLGESQNLEFLYWKVWEAVMSVLPIKEDFEEKIIMTNIDGFTKPYAMSDVMPRQAEAGGVIDVNLFKGIQDTWDKRQTLNRVAVKIPVRDAIVKSASAAETDNQAVVQYFHNPKSDTRIVVFGHSHEPRMIPSETHDGKTAVYVNSGTWIDKNAMPTRTFVVITTKGSARHVGLYRYSHEGAITTMDSMELADF